MFLLFFIHTKNTPDNLDQKWTVHLTVQLSAFPFLRIRIGRLVWKAPKKQTNKKKQLSVFIALYVPPYPGDFYKLGFFLKEKLFYRTHLCCSAPCWLLRKVVFSWRCALEAFKPAFNGCFVTMYSLYTPRLPSTSFSQYLAGNFAHYSW